MLLKIGGVWLWVDFDEVNLLRAEYVRLYPHGREAEWEGLNPLEILNYEIEYGEKYKTDVSYFALDYLDWDELPKLAEFPHLEQHWIDQKDWEFRYGAYYE